MSVKNNLDPFTPKALELFHAQVSILLRDDLGIEPILSDSLAEKAKNLLALEKGYAWPKIATNLEVNGIRSQWNFVLSRERSVSIVRWVSRWVVGNLLDLLCGEGKIGECLSLHGLQVTLTERENAYASNIYKHKVPFISLEELMSLSPKKQFDTVLLCTVLHHELNPEFILSLAARLAHRRIIIVENCIEPNYPADYQLLVDIFFNHCLNQTNLPSPANHKSLDEWLSYTNQWGKICRIEHKKNVPGIPLSHNLIVIDLERN